MNRTEDTATRVARLLSARPAKAWRITELAAEVHLSPSQLGRVFTARFGIPPMHYLACLRVRELARLLTETDLPVGVAMAQVGWPSRGHAARLFREATGMAPSAYRDRRRAGHGLVR